MKRKKKILDEDLVLEGEEYKIGDNHPVYFQQNESDRMVTLSDRMNNFLGAIWGNKNPIMKK